ncbi:MAG: hypothetical protein ACPF9D_10855 [Owenweeksia sp.]
MKTKYTRFTFIIVFLIGLMACDKNNNVSLFLRLKMTWNWGLR